MEYLDFERLPHVVISNFFEYFTFSEIVELRLVNKWFNTLCSGILNSSFSRVQTSLYTLLKKLIAALKQCIKEIEAFDNTLLMLHVNMFLILTSELQILSITCNRYIEYGVYSFTGGKILDCCKESIQVYYMNKNLDFYLSYYSTLTTHLFFYNQQFIDNFEDVIEPKILNEYPRSLCFGTKLIDLLDSYMHSNYHIEASYDGVICKIIAKYEILLLDSINEPPTLHKDINGLGKDSDLPALMKYFRNEVRWNNFLYCINLTTLTPRKDNERLNKFCLNDVNKYFEKKMINEEFVFHETFNRWISSSSLSQNVSYTVELECSPYCAPMRLTSFLTGAAQEDDDHVDLNRGPFPDIMEQIYDHYNFNCVFQAILSTSNNKVCVENSIQLYHDAENCLLHQQKRKIPL